MAGRYIGARYVPVYDGEWSSLKAYEPLVIVEDSQGNTYISRQNVPAGTALSNTTYWAKTNSFSTDLTNIKTRLSTVESSVSSLTSRISTAEGKISTLESDVSTLKNNVSTLQTNLSNLTTRVSTAERNITSLQNRATNLETDMDSVSDDLTVSFAAIHEDMEQIVQQLVDIITLS